MSETKGAYWRGTSVAGIVGRTEVVDVVDGGVCVVRSWGVGGLEDGRARASSEVPTEEMAQQVILRPARDFLCWTREVVWSMITRCCGSILVARFLTESYLTYLTSSRFMQGSIKYNPTITSYWYASFARVPAGNFTTTIYFNLNLQQERYHAYRHLWW